MCKQEVIVDKEDQISKDICEQLDKYIQQFNESYLDQPIHFEDSLDESLNEDFLFPCLV